MPRPSPVLVLGALATLAAPAHAFDWNGRTVTHELDVLDGRMAIESGHPLATARGFRLAKDAADRDATGSTAAALAFVLGDDYVDDRSDALQTVLFGSWLNEVRTSLDMGAPDSKLDPLGWAAKFMRWRYSDYLDGREHSDRWSRSTNYTSSNYQHSMLVESIDPAETITQDDVFDLLDEYSFWAMNAAALNLIVAKKGALEGSMSDEDVDLSWVAGLRYVGSVFHLVEDSAVTCNEAAKRHAPICIPGDGHTLVAQVDGRPRVVALSDNAHYERKVDGDTPHGELDGLYQDELLAAVYGDFDPAIATSQILVHIAVGVDAAVHEELADVPLFVDGEPNAEFDAMAFSISTRIAQETFDAVIGPRFADAGQRVALPVIGEDEEKFDDVDGDAVEGDSAAGCRTGGGTPGTLALLVLCAVGARRRRPS
jgi:MYXO-CTERM domain-containing protein